MKFEEILIFIKSNRDSKVRRSFWQEGDYLYIDKHNKWRMVAYGNNDEVRTVGICNIMAEDWEILKG